MTISVRFFAYFREVFGGRDRALDLPAGATVGEALAAVGDTPARRAELFAGADLKRHLVVMLNGSPLPSPGGLSTPLADGDTLAVFPLLGGG
jgi:MoaD family protein